MRRTFKYRLHPKKHQIEKLSFWLRQCTSLYNGALEHRRDAYRKASVSITLFEQQKELTKLRQSDKDWRSIPVMALRSALDRLDKAFQSFFRRVKKGDKPGYPRFRSCRRYDSFSLQALKVENSRVFIKKLGKLKINYYRPIEGKVKTTTIRRDRTGKWWICFSCELSDVVKALPKIAIGIDLGLNSFITLSNGTKIENPRFYRKAEAELTNRQQVFSRKEKGSKAREKARILVAKTSQKIFNRRLDHARKLACKLFAEYDLVAFEKLNIAGLVQGNLSKSIYDAAWRQFTQCLQNKAENAGLWAASVDPKYTIQECSDCGHRKKVERGDEWYDCPECELSLDRDHNAARNILKKAWPMPGLTAKASVFEAKPDPADSLYI